MPRKGFCGGAAGMADAEGSADFVRRREQTTVGDEQWRRSSLGNPLRSVGLYFAPDFFLVVNSGDRFGVNLILINRYVIDEKRVDQLQKGFCNLGNVFLVYDQTSDDTTKRHVFLPRLNPLCADIERQMAAPLSMGRSVQVSFIGFVKSTEDSINNYDCSHASTLVIYFVIL